MPENHLFFFLQEKISTKPCQTLLGGCENLIRILWIVLSDPGNSQRWVHKCLPQFGDICLIYTEWPAHCMLLPHLLTYTLHGLSPFHCFQSPHSKHLRRSTTNNQYTWGHTVEYRTGSFHAVIMLS